MWTFLHRQIDDIIRKSDDATVGDFKLVLPNQRHNNFIDLPTIAALSKKLERNIRLDKVRSLYADQQFAELVPILTDSLANAVASSDESTDGASSLMVTTQFEVLLEAFWSLECYEDCMIWSERCLAYALDEFVRAPSETYRQDKWAASVTFVLTYLEALILGETIAIGKLLTIATVNNK